MKRLFFTIAILLMPASIVLAQNDPNAAKEEITKVKKAENVYLYSDCTRTTEEAAIKDAYNTLYKKIENYASEQGSSKVDEKVKETINDSVSQITMARGDNGFRAFLYVTRSSVKHAFHGGASNHQHAVAQRQPSTTGYKPVNQPSNQPAASNYPSNQPAANRPAQQPAAANQPVNTVKPSPSISQSVADNQPVQPTATNQPNRPTQQPAANRPTQQPAAPKQPTQKPITQQAQTTTDDDFSDEPMSGGNSTDVISIMRQTKRIASLRSHLESWKASGAIDHYGKIGTVSNPDEYYLVLYTRSGDIRAILTPATPDRTNLFTGNIDQMSNYTGCSIECIKMN
ncbi:MAG: hypothetical protein Q4D03_09010 [Bacteroidales bacterium]|nr:hypothetical protein [Bacteroidales bacterium]